MFSTTFPFFKLVNFTNLNSEQFNELCENIKVLPGHHIKMKNCIDYLRQVNKFKIL